MIIFLNIKSLNFVTLNDSLIKYLDTYVALKRHVSTLQDLSPQESSDFFYAIQKAQNILEEKYETSSSTIVILDGKEIGQTIEVSLKHKNIKH